MSKIFSRIKLTYLFTNRYLSLARLVLIQILLMLRSSWNKVEIRLYQRCFNVASTSRTDVVSTLCKVENPTSDFVSFSTSDQRYFNVDPQRWNNVNPTLKCWLGIWLLFSATFTARFELVFCFSTCKRFFLEVLGNSRERY